MWHILIFIFGAIIGSFLNVVIYRLPKEEVTLWNPPYSFCPNCKKKIHWFDNIPILSYILLKGKCRYCGWRIPIRYFLVEVVNASGYLLNSFVFEDPFKMVSSCLILSTLIAITFIDLDTMLIPDSLNLLVLVGGFVIAFRSSFLEHFLSSLFALFMFLLMYRIYKGGMGMGDVFLAGSLGMMLGFFPTILTVLTASFSGIIYALVKNKGKVDMKLKIPFGPFLATSGYIIFILSNILGWSGWQRFF